MSVCLDASLLLKWMLREPGSDEVEKWLKLHLGEELVAPHLMPAEVASTLRRASRQGRIDPEQVQRSLDLLAELKPRLIWDWELIKRAFTLARGLSQSGVYDCLYLAVAEAVGCELWTADARFAQQAAPAYPQVRLLEVTTYGGRSASAARLLKHTTGRGPRDVQTIT
ncbi:MAG TPA: type II toxin-antitoxin system VapC family toxin [Firmicutes bacterium]|nr:type II toxin-antitoxin system VapC family toxin [Bacillota bacterium]